jgi:hypothetical protein
MHVQCLGSRPRPHSLNPFDHFILERVLHIRPRFHANSQLHVAGTLASTTELAVIFLHCSVFIIKYIQQWLF